MKRSSAACGEECYISPVLKRTKVQAQRKFAQGSNNYPYSATKIVSKTSAQQMSSPDNEEYELNNFSRLPSVDDFLTFLCFRETDVLPERLNYLNTPQFDVCSIKKKQSKLTTTTLSVNATNSDQNRKVKQSKNDLKNKKQGEYKLRSRSVSGKGVVTKTSCSLAIKHNQRLRSKSVVQAKICENKLQNFKKFKPHALTNPKVKNENLTTKSIIKKEIANKFGNHDFDNFQRVTRRNSLLEKPSERISLVPTKVVSKKSVLRKPDTSLENREISVCLRDSEVDNSKKPAARSLDISLPKVKHAITKSLVSNRASLKPTTRITRSHTVQEDASFQKVNMRLSRRTKEAAALYTKMITKELLRSEDNFEDDDISVGSFPELPNTEQHMRREKELKQMKRKKNLEKPVSRKTSHTKTKLYVRPCENCMPSKIASASSKVTEELSKVEDRDKTRKEHVKVAECIKMKNRPKSLELRKNPNNSLKSTQPAKITKEPSKVINHMQIVKELSRTTEPVETVKKLSEVVEHKKALTKTTTLIRNDKKLSNLSEVVNNVTETSRSTRNGKTPCKSLVCLEKSSNIPAKQLKKNTSKLIVHTKKQSCETVEQVKEISAELTEQFRKKSPSFEECCKGVSCNCSEQSKNELSKHAKQITITTPKSAIELNEKTADLAEQLSKGSANSVEPIWKESTECVEQIMTSPCKSTEQVKKESAKQSQSERRGIFSSKSVELTKKELDKPVEQVKEVFSRHEQQSKNKIITYAEPFNNETSTSAEQIKKELSRSVEKIPSKPVEQIKQISSNLEKQFKKETFEYAKLNKKGSLKTKQIVPFRYFEQIDEISNKHKEQVRQETHESAQHICDILSQPIEPKEKEFSTLDNQAKNDNGIFTEETLEELPRTAEQIKGKSKFPEQMEKNSSELSLQIQKESSASIQQYKKNLSKSTEQIENSLSKPLNRVEHELLKVTEQNENNISKPTAQININFVEFSEQFNENSSKPTEPVKKYPSKSIDGVKADSSELKEKLETDFEKSVAQVEKKTFKFLGQVKKELFKSKEPVRKESLESAEEIITELPKSVLIRKELSGTGKKETTKPAEKNKSISREFEHWKMKQPGEISEQSIKRKDLLINSECKRTADKIDKAVEDNNPLEASSVAVNYSNMSEDLLKSSGLLKVSKEPSKCVAKKEMVDKQIESSIQINTSEESAENNEKINLLNEQSTTVEQRKINSDTEKESIKNNGLCTRSKQYNSELNNEHSVKIIRTRVRNTNSLERRSSFNDRFDKSKHVNNIVRESKRKCAKHISFAEYSSVESDYEDSDDDKPIIEMVIPKSAQAVEAVEKKIDNKKIQTQQLHSSLKSKSIIKKFKKCNSSIERRKSCSDAVGKVKLLDPYSTLFKNDKLVNSSSLNDFKETKFVDTSVEENVDSAYSSSTKITDSNFMSYENSGLPPNKKIVASQLETSMVEKINVVDSSVSSNDTVLESVSKAITTSDDTDFKRPLQERQFFSRAKTAKNESKPMIQTVISSSSRVFNLESKKISPITPEQKEEVSPKKSEAFSADNENSVYAFEPDLPTTSPPFRRLKPVTPPKSIASNSIAIQVNFENDSKLEYSNSSEAQVSSTTDCIGDRVFYIPIQTSTLSSTLGVAVKLDTDGNSQKIIMSATLITNSPTCTSNTTTAVCSKTSDVGTTCTLTEMMALSNKEQVTRKPCYSAPSAESGKTINSVDDKNEQDPCSSTVSISKNIKNIPVRGNSQSVRILKINKNKKMKKQINEAKRLGYSVSNLKPKPISSESGISETKRIHRYQNNSETSLNARKMESLSIDAESIEPISTSVDSELIKPETTSVKSFQRSSKVVKFETPKTRLHSTNSRIAEPEVVFAKPSFGVDTVKCDNVKVNFASVNSQITVPAPLKTNILSVDLEKNKLRTTNAEARPANLEITKLEQSKLFQSSYTETGEQRTLKMKTMSVCSDAGRLKIPKTNSQPTDLEAKKQEAIKIKSQIINSEAMKVDVRRTNSRPLNSASLEPEAVKMKSRPAKNKSSRSIVQESKSDTDKQLSTPQGKILEAPTFYPSEEEFNDPLEYIDKIRSEAEKFGLCRIVPPSNFRPECKVADEMRFTAYNQYVHKMLHRWGPNVKEMMAIKKFLATQNITFTHPPWIGGMEVDLPHLYQIVQQCGGLKAVIEKERWQMVADIMRIPKLAQDRITKLDDIYCKYLLPYDILSHDEREKLFEEIEKEWMDHLKNPSDDEVFEDIDECIVKGRTMPLSCFYRIARNTMMMCFGNMEGQEGPSTETIEAKFWNHVSKRKSHICVHCGSIDSGTYGYGFSVAKNSTFRKHPWNLKVLTNNSASILRFLGPVMGVTVPTLHVGMLYSACCWYRDPHGLPWIEYLHTGANKIWYGISDDHSEQFREAMLLLVPRYCKDKKIWLPSDTVMIPPPLLTSHNIPLSRVVQQPGQFIVVFPKAFTSSISTGYLVSESVYFAHASWLNTGKQVFMDMQDSCEPSVFSFEQLLINIAEDTRPSLSILMKVLPLLLDLRETETTLRSQLKKMGLCTFEKLNVNRKHKTKGTLYEEDSYECDTCHTFLFISLVVNSNEQCHYCLKHAISLLNKKPTQLKHCTLMYAYTEGELDELISKVKARIEAKSSKKSHSK